MEVDWQIFGQFFRHCMNKFFYQINYKIKNSQTFSWCTGIFFCIDYWCLEWDNKVWPDNQLNEKKRTLLESLQIWKNLAQFKERYTKQKNYRNICHFKNICQLQQQTDKYSILMQNFLVSKMKKCILYLLDGHNLEIFEFGIFLLDGLQQRMAHCVKRISSTERNRRTPHYGAHHGIWLYS